MLLATLRSARRQVAIGLALTLGALPLAAGAQSEGSGRQPHTVTQTGNTPGEAFAFQNTNPAGGGLLGEVGPSLYPSTRAGISGVYEPGTSTIGYGVFGYSSTSYGIYGKTTAPGYSGVFGVSVSVGVIGLSTGSSGVVGETSVPDNVNYASIFPFDSSNYAGKAGTYGKDLSPAAISRSYVNENVGVVGTSQYGLAGVLGVLTGASPYGSVAGVLGTNFGADEEGVFGRDSSTSTSSSGLFGSSTDGTGTTTFSNGGEGLNVYSGAAVALEADNATLNRAPPLLVQSDVADASYPVVIVDNNFDESPRNDIFSIGGTGNVVAAGTITASSSPLEVTHGANGGRYVAYGSRTSSPTIEDVGFGTLTNGSANVRLEPTFASTIDPHAPYAVFISPEGDNNGLYVTAKTASSFAVREVHGGHSTLPFSYRIVARPLDMAQAQRLPDARTAIVKPIFDDSKERAMDPIRKAERERVMREFAKKN